MASYVNNRRQSDAGATWQHDAGGEVVSITHPGSPDYQQYALDAAGRTIQDTELKAMTDGKVTFHLCSTTQDFSLPTFRSAATW